MKYGIEIKISKNLKYITLHIIEKHFQDYAIPLFIIYYRNFEMLR